MLELATRRYDVKIKLRTPPGRRQEVGGRSTCERQVPTVPSLTIIMALIL